MSLPWSLSVTLNLGEVRGKDGLSTNMAMDFRAQQLGPLSVLPTVAGGLQVMLLVKSDLQPAKKLVQEMRLNSMQF